jgi:RimJ/RimL family protein N-acetyltransferase
VDRRAVAPLWDIRVRTPRLELRLPTDDELEELYEVAAAGIHPPEEMPFAVAWTDDLRRDAFLDFHHAFPRDWSPERWGLPLVTFRAGEPIGTQGVNATGFAVRKEVETGSWLGRRFQRLGYGTEQRAAVLELAFAGLGAEAALSGALVPNVASQRISEKLGYSMTGTREVAPRGEPVAHFDYRLDRGEWRCPVEVELEGVDETLHLFGAVGRRERPTGT